MGAEDRMYKKVLVIMMKEYKSSAENGNEVNKEAFKDMELFMEKFFLPDLAWAVAKEMK